MSKSIIVAGNLVLCREQGKRFAVRGQNAWSGAIGGVHLQGWANEDYIRFHSFEMEELVEWCHEHPNLIQNYHYSNT